MLALEELAVAAETSALMKRLFFEVGLSLKLALLYADPERTWGYFP